MTDELERRLGAASVPALDFEALRSQLARRAAGEGLLDVAHGTYDSPLGRLTVMVTPLCAAAGKKRGWKISTRYFCA